MVDRRALERRVYRLATLLTGHPLAATRVIESVIDAQPDLGRLDSAHLDRLTVLRCRELLAASSRGEAGVIADESAPRRLVEALARLHVQEREAWVFARVYRMNEREMARAMDCSVTATRRHLAGADSIMAGSTDVSADATAAETLLNWSMSLDVPRFYDEVRRRRRHRRVVLWIVGALVGLTGLMLLIQAWS